jgi:hypothetical protein
VRIAVALTNALGSDNIVTTYLDSIKGYRAAVNLISRNFDTVQFFEVCIRHVSIQRIGVVNQVQ